jgi:hypothetical protein
MTEKKQSKKHFFAFPQTWNHLSEKEQEEWVDQLYDLMIKKTQEAE